MSDWLRDSSTEKLRQIGAYHGNADVVGRAANEEVRRRENEEAKKDAHERESQEQKRHEVLVASQKDSKNNSHDNWYKKIIIGVIIGAVVLFLKYAFGL